jgi:hypothetical protein
MVTSITHSMKEIVMGTNQFCGKVVSFVDSTGSGIVTGIAGGGDYDEQGCMGVWNDVQREWCDAEDDWHDDPRWPDRWALYFHRVHPSAIIRVYDEQTEEDKQVIELLRTKWKDYDAKSAELGVRRERRSAEATLNKML